MKKIFAVISVLLFACTPKHSQWEDVTQRLAIYYSRPIDSIKKHIEITDSCSIKTLKLSFYSFSDSSNGKHDKLITGQIIKDNSSNNYYIYSWKNTAPSLMQQEAFFNYYRKKDSNKLATYSFNGASWQFQKMESVLNNLPLEVKKKVNKAVLDTFIQVVFWGQYNLKRKGYSSHVNYSSIVSKTTFDTIFENDYIGYRERNYELMGYQLANMKLFKEFVDSLFDNGTLYLYSIPAQSPEYLILITVNDEFKSDSLASEYIRNYSNEVALFNFKIYVLAENQ